jgi:hypothetical protein
LLNGGVRIDYSLSQDGDALLELAVPCAGVLQFVAPNVCVRQLSYDRLRIALAQFRDMSAEFEMFQFSLGQSPSPNYSST